MVDTPFTTYAFPTTGGSISRTLADRLAHIKNVRDFGAKGDSVTDDWAAIMAAVNWTTGNNQRGTVYFPPGTYLVSAPINFNGIPNNTATYFFLGEGGASVITGNFADYVFSRKGTPPGNPVGNSGPRTLQKLTIINQNANGGGIRLGVTVGGSIRDCDITANLGITDDNTDVPDGSGNWEPSLEISIENCTLRPFTNRAAGSVGITKGADGAVTNCRLYNYEIGGKTYSGEQSSSWQGCYFEGNSLAAIAVGVIPTSTTLTSGIGMVAVLGNRFKNNGTGILIKTGSVSVFGNVVEGTNGTIGGANPQYGIRLFSGAAQRCFVAGNKVSGQYDIAAFDTGGGEQFNVFNAVAGVSATNSSVTGGAVAWKLPTTAMTTAGYSAVNVALTYNVSALPATLATVTSASWAAGVVTMAVSGVPTAGVNGARLSLVVSGVTPSGYNGTVTGTGTGFNTFTYPLVADPGGAGTGGTVFINLVSSSILAGNASEGDCYDVKNASVATWGSILPSTTGTNHVKVRFTPAGWTIVGK